MKFLSVNELYCPTSKFPKNIVNLFAVCSLLSFLSQCIQNCEPLCRRIEYFFVGVKQISLQFVACKLLQIPWNTIKKNVGELTAAIERHLYSPRE